MSKRYVKLSEMRVLISRTLCFCRWLQKQLTQWGSNAKSHYPSMTQSELTLELWNSQIWPLVILRDYGCAVKLKVKNGIWGVAVCKSHTSRTDGQWGRPWVNPEPALIYCQEENSANSTLKGQRFWDGWPIRWVKKEKEKRKQETELTMSFA